MTKKLIPTSGASLCLHTMSEVSLATRLVTSSWNCSENLLLLDAPSRPVVARCSTIAFTISSRKNQPEARAASLGLPAQMLHCRTSCSWTNLADRDAEAEEALEDPEVLANPAGARFPGKKE